MRIFYAQSGGVTSVLNSSTYGLIKSARALGIDVLIGLYGIKGALNSQFIDTSSLSDHDLEALAYTPGGSFGSCRYKLKQEDFPRLGEFFVKQGVDVLIYQGGGDSQDTTLRLDEYFQGNAIPVRAIGLPKTIDNDLYGTDQSPGFGSTAKYLATSMREACLDLSSMCQDSTKVFLMETMGRHSGWLAVSTLLAHHRYFPGPHGVLIPEIDQPKEALFELIQEKIRFDGYCVLAVSEGLPGSLDHTLPCDSFGHAQLQGASARLATCIRNELGYKVRCTIPDILQRSAGHLLSKLDWDQAQALGRHAVELVAFNHSIRGVMLGIERLSDEPYTWTIKTSELAQVANRERLVPRSFLDHQGWHLSEQGWSYLSPLIQGEVPLRWNQGIPAYWGHVRHQGAQAAQLDGEAVIQN